MKTILILCLLLFPNTVLSQTILGVKLGSTYDSVKKTLVQKYGRVRVIDDRDEDYDKFISIRNVTFGGVKFDKVGFYFLYANSRSYCRFIRFQQHYGSNMIDCAYTDADKLYDFVDRVYGETAHIPPEDVSYTVYYRVSFGTNPYNTEYSLGTIRIIDYGSTEYKKIYHLLLDFGMTDSYYDYTKSPQK